MKHTARNMVPAIGAQVTISTGVNDLAVECKVMDVKSSWGNIRLLVQPLMGSGSAWVELSRLRQTETSKSIVINN